MKTKGRRKSKNVSDVRAYDSSVSTMPVGLGRLRNKAVMAKITKDRDAGALSKAGGKQSMTSVKSTKPKGPRFPKRSRNPYE